jgi:allantoate deiminase
MPVCNPMTAAETVMERCDALAAFTEEPGRLTRRFGTPALRAASDQVAEWMRAAGLEPRRDAVGNLIGRREGAGGTLVLGSHLDTVRDAGRYDGMLGVLVALASAERARLPCALEVVAFADEEGVRYGTSYLGSAALAGRFDPAWRERADADGIRLGDLLEGELPAARDDVLAYVEAHIEQGPRLEAAGLPVGVVTQIVAQAHARVEFAGRAGHAGTTPMDMRADALCAAAEWILAVESCGAVATVGMAAVEPGAANVIPGRARLSLDVRDDTRVLGALRERAEAIGVARGVAVAWDTTDETPAVACDPALTDALARAVREAGHEVARLPSGAGHDAAMMAAVAPVAMLFVRCAGGISHHPDESVAVEDVAAAIDVLDRFLARWPT